MNYSSILQLLQNYDALLIANGAHPKKGLFTLLRQCSRVLIALDGGVNLLRKLNVAPDHVLGDFDSAETAALAWAVEVGAKIHRKPSQVEPDFVKGLRFCRQNRFKTVAVMCADGDRLDHTLVSLHSAFLLRGVHLVFVTDSVIVFPLSGKTQRRFAVPRGHTVSWIPLDEAKGCSLSGVKWSFQNRSLKVGGFYSLSNQTTTEEVHLKQQSGKSLLMIGLERTE